MTETLCIWDEDGNHIEIPAKYEVCDRCEGRGKHGNEAFDGLSLEWFHEQGEEFVENYFSGRYDVRCHECGGDRVVLVADEDRLDEDERRAWHYHLQYLADDAQERHMQERHGW